MGQVMKYTSPDICADTWAGHLEEARGSEFQASLDYTKKPRL